MKINHRMVVTGPASRLKEALSQSGFSRDLVRGSAYRLELEAPEGVFVLQVPCEETDGMLSVFGEKAFFEGIADGDLPERVKAAALERWLVLRARLDAASPPAYSPERGDRRPSSPMRSRPVETAANGSMVQDFADMQRLGRDMQRMKTEQQLDAEGLVDDPIQH